MASLYTPRSPQFGQSETEATWTSKFGPRAADVGRAKIWLSTRGLHVEWRPGDAWLSATGTANQLRSVFGVDPHRFRAGTGEVFTASTSDAVIPAALRPLVSGVSQLRTDGRGMHPLAIPALGLAPVDLLKAYDLQPLADLGFDGSGETVALLELGDGYSQENLDAFTAKYQLPPLHPIDRMQMRTEKDGSSHQVNSPDSTQLPEGSELEMDLQVVHEIAPGATIVIYQYIQYADPQDPGKGWDEAAFRQVEEQMIADSQGGIVSISLGGVEQTSGEAAIDEGIYSKAAGMRESVFASSGDNGAYSCLRLFPKGTAPSTEAVCVETPASVPWVTAVGGTLLSVRNDGSWYDERVWEDPMATLGPGGGHSRAYPRPEWQSAPGIEVLTGAMREVPDVAADADPASGAAYNYGGRYIRGGGTSQSAPIWAGMTALINQFLKTQGAPSLGFANTALYTLARTAQPFPPYHDVTIGTNLVYPAAPGYDLATGLGTPDGWNLARDLLAYAKAGSP